MPAWFYILRLTSRNLYPGSTRNKVRRYREHFKGRGGRTTRIDPPESVVYEEEYPTYRLARIRELQVKRWSRSKKEALVSGDLNRLRELAKSRD
jgi:putative endonuclease